MVSVCLAHKGSTTSIHWASQPKTGLHVGKHQGLEIVRNMRSIYWCRTMRARLLNLCLCNVCGCPLPEDTLSLNLQWYQRCRPLFQIIIIMPWATSEKLICAHIILSWISPVVKRTESLNRPHDVYNQVPINLFCRTSLVTQLGWRHLDYLCKKQDFKPT